MQEQNPLRRKQGAKGDPQGCDQDVKKEKGTKGQMFNQNGGGHEKAEEHDKDAVQLGKVKLDHELVHPRSQ